MAEVNHDGVEKTIRDGEDAEVEKTTAIEQTTTIKQTTGIGESTEIEDTAETHKTQTKSTGFSAFPAELRDLVKDYALQGGTAWKYLRPINKKFRDIMDYIPFGILQDKILDIRNPHHLQSLEEISKDPVLAQQLTSLHFTCCYKKYHDDEIFPVALQNFLSPSAYNKWHELKVANGVYGQSWRFPTMGHMFLGGNYDEIAQHVMDNEAIMNSLAHALSKFTLKSVEFVEPERHASSRYTFMSEELKARQDNSALGAAGVRQAAYMGMLTGLDILLRALNQAGKSPKRFTLPVPTLWYTGFGSFSSQNVLRSVCKGTEELVVRQIKNVTLHLRDIAVHPTRDLQHSLPSKKYISSPPDGVFNAPGEAEEMLFIDSNFPALKHLTIDIGSGNPRQLESQLNPSHTITKLEHLIIKQDTAYESLGTLYPTIITRRALIHEDDPLKHFLPALQHLTLINIYTGRWNDFLQNLNSSGRLEKLEVIVENRVWDEEPQKGFECTQKRWNDAARSATIEPEVLRKRVEEVWYRQRESAGRLEQLDEDVDNFGYNEEDAVGEDEEEDIEDQAAQQEEEIAGTNEDEHDGNQVVGDLEDSA
jgi:hypothetical protein